MDISPKHIENDAAGGEERKVGTKWNETKKRECTTAAIEPLDPSLSQRPLTNTTGELTSSNTPAATIRSTQTHTLSKNERNSEVEVGQENKILVKATWLLFFKALMSPHPLLTFLGQIAMGLHFQFKYCILKTGVSWSQGCRPFIQLSPLYSEVFILIRYCSFYLFLHLNSLEVIVLPPGPFRSYFVRLFFHVFWAKNGL